MLFKIPENWAWCRLQNVVFYQEGPGIRNWQFKHEGVKLLNVQNIVNGTLILTNTDKYVSEEEFNEKYKHFLIEDGDLLFASSGGSWGKTAWFIDPGYKVMLNTSTMRLRFYDDEYYPNYLEYFINSLFFKMQLTKQLVGMQPNFGSTHFGRAYIPIPPINEQKKIVAKVDQMLLLLSQLEAQQKKAQAKGTRISNVVADRLMNPDTPADYKKYWQVAFNNFDLLYSTVESVKKLREVILQLAVQGKLLPQNPADEPASELLKKIEQEKAKLIKEGKLKKQEPLPAITEDEKPFDLPQGWEWVRLGTFGILERGKSKHRPRNDKKLFENGTYPFIQTGDVANAQTYIKSYTKTYNDIGLQQSKLWEKGTLCITIAANIADVGILTFDACFPDSIVAFKHLIDILPIKYIYYYILTAKNNLEEFAPAT